MPILMLGVSFFDAFGSLTFKHTLNLGLDYFLDEEQTEGSVVLSHHSVSPVGWGC